MAIFNLIIAYLGALFGPCYAMTNPIIYERPPQVIVERMQTMGIGYKYKLMPDGRLYVDQGQGWKRLRY